MRRVNVGGDMGIRKRRGRWDSEREWHQPMLGSNVKPARRSSLSSTLYIITGMADASPFPCSTMHRSPPEPPPPPPSRATIYVLCPLLNIPNLFWFCCVPPNLNANLANTDDDNDEDDDKDGDGILKWRMELLE